MISKELLSEVLELKIETVAEGERTTYYKVIDEDNQTDTFSINIHELAHKCKEWAWWNGYNILIEKHGLGGTINEAHIKCHSFSKTVRHNEFAPYYPKEDTEPEAIFKACEWIMEQTEK